MTRRDRCHLTAKRAQKLTRGESAYAWFVVAAHLEALGDPERTAHQVPKFKDLLRAIRKATIAARSWGRGR